MKKVISLSLFGEANRYAQYAPAVVRAHLALFPLSEGWMLRIHHDQHLRLNFYGNVLTALEQQGLIELRYMGETPPLCKGMLWRMAPLFDESVDVVFCRDIDALPLPRDRKAMEAFIDSDALIHAVGDHPMHCGLMGGMSGFKWPIRGSLKSLEDIHEKAGNVDWSRHGVDQEVMAQLITPRFAMFEHYHTTPREIFNTVRAEQIPQTGSGPLSEEMLVEADKLAAHIGAAGFDVENAIRFYDSVQFEGLHIIQEVECGRH